MIQAQNLSKYYGSKRALGPVSFEIEDGETVGFLGLNGAGKTTALRIFACDLRPSTGTVAVGKHDAVENPHEVRKRIGYVPENPPLYKDMIVDEYLEYAGRLQGMSSAQVQKRLPKATEVTDLGEVRNEVIGTLSHGYRQRVGVAQAIMNEPQLLIMDEPTRGLDPVQIVEMRSLIADLKGDHTVLVSSHILTEISETCDRALVLNKGKIISTVSLKDEVKRLNVELVADGDEAAKKVEEAIAAVDGVENLKLATQDGDSLHFQMDYDDALRAPVAKAVVESGCGLLSLGLAQRQLEAVFLDLVKGKSGGN